MGNHPELLNTAHQPDQSCITENSLDHQLGGMDGLEPISLHLTELVQYSNRK